MAAGSDHARYDGTQDHASHDMVEAHYHASSTTQALVLEAVHRFFGRDPGFGALGIVRIPDLALHPPPKWPPITSLWILGTADRLVEMMG